MMNTHALPEHLPLRRLAPRPARRLAGLAMFCSVALLGSSQKHLIAQTGLTQQAEPVLQEHADSKMAGDDSAGPPSLAAPRVPFRQPASSARVTWDNRSLTIRAANASLSDILRKVAALTGASLEGLPLHRDQIPDERVFGSFGPGAGCDVLSDLLEGSGLNILMTGSRDGNAPMRIILSARTTGDPSAAVSHHDQVRPASHEAHTTPEPDPQKDRSFEATAPRPPQDPFNIGGATRDPGEFMQEVLQRQQVIDQEAQQQKQQQQDQLRP